MWQAAVADTEESLVIERHLRESDLLIKATEAAVSIPTLATEESALAKQKYRIRNYLDELTMIAYHQLVGLLESASNDQWTQSLTKAQWTERLIRHFLDHHRGSASEGWMIMCKLYLLDRKVTTELFRGLNAEQQKRVLADLRSPFDGCGSEACVEFASALEKMR